MKNKSFTLIELLVVIVIIGILAGVIIVSTSSSISKANFAKAQAFSNTVQQELLLNLVSEWTFDNASNLGEDTWGNNNGTVYGSPVLAIKEECVYGTCLIFDGVDDYLNCGQGVNNSLQLVDSMTFELWIEPDDFLVRRSVIYKAYLGEISITQEMSKNINFYYGTSLDTQGFSIGGVVANSWSHIVIVRNLDPSVMKVTRYINGQKIGDTTAYFAQAYASANSFLIGDGYLPSFKGKLDDIRIYNTALSTSQIKQNYIAGLNSLLANNNISKEEYDQRLNNLAYDKE